MTSVHLEIPRGCNMDKQHLDIITVGMEHLYVQNEYMQSYHI